MAALQTPKESYWPPSTVPLHSPSENIRTIP